MNAEPPAPDLPPPLDERSVPPEPFALFARWFDEVRALGLPEPHAVVLATATPDGAPSARAVLFRDAGPDGFSFFTNHESRKGRELAANPRAALCFHWQALRRQVRVEGRVAPVARAVTEAYWRTRPRGSQLGAWASPQSEVVGGREELDARYREARERFDGREVPVPEHWGGYRLEARVVEFWVHREDRMHDRVVYRRAATGWKVERLGP